MQGLEQIRDCAHADPAVRNADPSLGPKVHHDLGAHTGLVPDDARLPEKKLPYKIFHSISPLLLNPVPWTLNPSYRCLSMIRSSLKSLSMRYCGVTFIRASSGMRPISSDSRTCTP